MKTTTKWILLLKASMCTAGRMSTFRSSRRRLIAACVALLGGLLLSSLAQAVTVKAGDILVTDRGANKLILVDAQSGARSVLSDFPNPAQGPVNGPDLALDGIAIGRGQIFVADNRVGIFRIDPGTGRRSLVSSFHEGNEGFIGLGMAMDGLGRLVAGGSPNGSFRPPYSFVDRFSPRTGHRVMVTDFTNPAQGVYIPDYFITDLALEHNGTILVSTASFQLANVNQGAIYRVDPVTGYRTMFSDFGNAAQGTVILDLHFTAGLAVERNGTVLFNSSGNEVRNLLMKIDPRNGNRTILSDFDNPAQGPTGLALYGAAVENHRHALVGALASTGVDPVSWTPILWNRRCLPWESTTTPTRRNSGRRWSS